MSELSTFITANMRQWLTFCKTSVFLIMGGTGLVISADGVSCWSSLVLQLPSLLVCASPLHCWLCDSGLAVVWAFRQMYFLEKGHKAEGLFLEKEKQSKLALPTYGSNALCAPW